MRTFLLLVLILTSGCFRIETGPGGSDFYRTDPRYTAGIPFQTIDPTTGQTVIVPGSPLRAHWAIESYEDARTIYHPRSGGKR